MVVLVRRQPSRSITVMATENQYKFYRALYDEENDRYGLLEARAKLYLTILTFYLGSLAFKITDVKIFFSEFAIPLAIAMAAGLAFVIALLCCISAILIRKYEAITDPEELIASLGLNPPRDDEFFDDRIVDMAVATNRNSRQNDRAANALQAAGLLMAAGVVLHVVVFVIALLK